MASKHNFSVKRRITILKPAEELYRAWREPEQLAQFMAGVESVKVEDERRAWWQAYVPGLGSTAWLAEITKEQENQSISWRTVAEPDFDHEGDVRFNPAPDGRSTEVELEIRSNLSGGRIMSAMAKLHGPSPEDFVTKTLSSCKQLMETGEVATNKGPMGQPRPPKTRSKTATAGVAVALASGLLYMRRRAAER